MIKTVLDQRKNTLTFGNGILTRTWRLDPPFGTISYRFNFCLHNLAADTAVSREAVLSLDGKPVSLSGGDLIYTGHSADEAAGGTILHIFLGGAGPAVAEDVRVGLHYQLFPGRAYLVKWLTVEKTGPGEVSVDAVSPEIIAMPMPPGTLRMVQPMSLHRYAQWRSGANQARFRYRDKDFSTPGDTPIFFLDRPPGFTPYGCGFTTDYANIVEGLFVDHGVSDRGGSRIDIAGVANPPEVAVRYALGPDTPVSSGTPFESFKVYEFFFDGGFEDGTLAFRRMVRDLCPWVEKNYLTFLSNRDGGPEQCRESIDRAADAGFECWMPAFRTIFARHDGQLKINPEYFPRGMEQVRELAGYAHEKKLKICTYLGLEWALWDMKDSEVMRKNQHLVGNDGRGFPFPDRPQTACYASGFEDEILARILDFLRRSGFDGVDPDGPYDGWLCYADGHRHRSPAHSQYLQWEAQRKFYRILRSLGYWLDAPGALSSLFHGNGPIPVGAEYWQVEAPVGDQAMAHIYDGWEEILTVRRDLWYASFLFPPTALRHSLSVWSSLDKHPDEMVEHWLATLLGYGVQATFIGDISGIGLEVFRKWLAFFKRYRAILESDVIHLICPSGAGLDGIMHVNPAATPNGLIMLYNPTGVALRRTVLVPAGHFPRAAFLEVKDRDGRTGEMKIEPRSVPEDIIEGNYPPGTPWGVLETVLGPREIAWFELRPGKEAG